MFRSALDPTPPLPLLITGVAGVAGYNALAYFQGRYPGQVIGIRQQDNWRLSGPRHRGLQCRGPWIAALFEAPQVRSVLDCAGNCALKACELDPAMAWRINVEGADNLVTLAADHGAGSCTCRSIWCFPGEGRWACRKRSTDPVTVYGKTMVAAEQLIAEAIPRRASCGSRCQWASASMAMPGPSIGFNLAFQIEAGHTLFRRGPHANLHRLPESAVLGGASERFAWAISRRRSTGL